MQIHGCLRFLSNRLQPVALALLLSVAGASQTAARETYVQYATRILAAPPEGVVARPDLEDAVLRATNAYIASKRLNALTPAVTPLHKAAQAHAMDLLLQGTMGHVSSTGYNFESRMRAFQPGQMMLAPMAENAARLRHSDLSDSAKAQALVQQWISSSGHRKNMVNRTYTSIAVGVVSRGNDVYAVQIFSGPAVHTNMTIGQRQN